MISISISVGNGPLERHTSVFIDYQLLQCPDWGWHTQFGQDPSLCVIQRIFQRSYLFLFLLGLRYHVHV